MYRTRCVRTFFSLALIAAVFSVMSPVGHGHTDNRRLHLASSALSRPDELSSSRDYVAHFAVRYADGQELTNSLVYGGSCGDVFSEQSPIVHVATNPPGAGFDLYKGFSCPNGATWLGHWHGNTTFNPPLDATAIQYIGEVGG